MARRHSRKRPSHGRERADASARGTGRGRGRGGFFRGLALGLGVAAVVQLHHGGIPDWLGGRTDERAGASSRAEAPSRDEAPDTNFDFYRLLPKAEVRVDEPVAPADPPPSTESTAERSGTEAAREPAPRPVSLAPSGYQVQVGSFRIWQQADRLRASLSLGGFESSIQSRNMASGTWHRVMLGPFRTREAAEAAKTRVRTARGIDARVVRENR